MREWKRRKGGNLRGQRGTVPPTFRVGIPNNSSVCMRGRSGGIRRESFSFLGQPSSNTVVTQLVAWLQEEAVVVSSCLLKPPAQRSRETLRGTEVRDQAGPQTAGSHARPHRRTGLLNVSLWDRGTCPPNIYEGGTSIVMSPQYFRSDVV